MLNTDLSLIFSGEFHPALQHIQYDIDSVWALSKTLDAFEIPSGIHHVRGSLLLASQHIDFRKKRQHSHMR